MNAPSAWLWADSNKPKFSPITKEIRHGMGVDADRWNPRIFWRIEEDVQSTS